MRGLDLSSWSGALTTVIGIALFALIALLGVFVVKTLRAQRRIAK